MDELFRNASQKCGLKTSQRPIAKDQWLLGAMNSSLPTNQPKLKANGCQSPQPINSASPAP